MRNQLNLRVAYADTDQMGMVYYGNYLTFFERGRTELLREVGLEYKVIEERGFYFPVMHTECFYHASAKYDDLLTIETWLSELTAASLRCSYEIKCGNKLIATGTTKHPFVNKSYKPVRFPPDIKEIMEKHLEK